MRRIETWKPRIIWIRRIGQDKADLEGTRASPDLGRWCIGGRHSLPLAAFAILYMLNVKSRIFIFFVFSNLSWNL